MKLYALEKERQLCYRSLLLCCVHMSLNSIAPSPQCIIYPPPSITIYNNTHVDQTSTTSSKQTDSWSRIPEQLRSLSCTSLKQFQERCYNFFYHNKVQVMGASACASYGMAYLRLRTAYDYLTQEMLWSNWPHDFSTKQLLYMSEQTLLQDLIHEIKQRSTNCDGHFDCMSPYETFLKETSEEITHIQTCKTLYEWLDWMYLTRILAVDTTCFECIDDKLQRVRYLRHILKRWMAEQHHAA